MANDLTTLTPQELAERAAACMGWKLKSCFEYDYWTGIGCPSNMVVCGSWRTEPQPCRYWNPLHDDNQAAELMRAAVAKCGAEAFAQALLRIGSGSPSVWLATADARARTIAAVACLEATDPKPENERGE